MIKQAFRYVRRQAHIVKEIKQMQAIRDDSAIRLKFGALIVCNFKFLVSLIHILMWVLQSAC